MNAASINPRRLHEDVVAVLVGQIVAGDIRPGEALPAEPEMSARLGVSRTVLREALRILAAKGLIDVRHGSGTRVTPSERWDPLDATVLAARRERGAMVAVLQDLLEARMIVECEVAALAAERAQQAHIELLAEAIAGMAGSLDDPATFIQHDSAFHRGLLAAVDNAVLLRLAESVQELVHFSQQTTDSIAGVLERALGDHRTIFRAVERGDPVGARRAMRRHLTRTERDIRSLIRVP